MDGQRPRAGLGQPQPPPKLREKLQVKLWVQTQQSSRKSLSFTLLWEFGGRDPTFLQEKGKSAKVVPVQRANFGTSCSCNTHPLLVKTSFPHLSSEWAETAPTSSEQSHELSFSGRDFRPALSISSLSGRVRGCLRALPTSPEQLPHPWRLRAMDWGSLLAHKKWDRKILMSHLCSPVYLSKMWNGRAVGRHSPFQPYLNTTALL